MLDTTLKLYAEDGFLLFDPTWKIEDWDWFSACLSVVLDPEGKTNQTEDDWPEFYARAVVELRHFIGSRAFIPILITPIFSGTYFVHLTVGTYTPSTQQREHCVAPLHVEGGELCLSDAMLLWDLEDGDTIEDNLKFALSKGYYSVHISSLHVPENVDRYIGEHGSEEHPAIQIVFEPCETQSLPVSEASAPFPQLSFSSGIQPGMICDATVRRIEGEKVSLRMGIGYARMSLPAHKALKPGDFVHVRLLEDRRNFWRVELVEG